MDLCQGEGVVTSSTVVNPHLSISVMVSPADQGKVPHPLIVPEFLRSTSRGMTSARGQGAIVYCLNSGSGERQTGRHNRFCEGDTRNRWRDGQVCPDVDKELWRLGPDGSGVFWRVMRQKDEGGQEILWKRGQEEKNKRVRDRERTEGGGETEKRERRLKESRRERESEARLEWKKGLRPEIGVKKTMNAGGVENGTMN
ncbi:hypothetical protein TNCV_4558451 [Trichonephila clavipes]|nr:hypothetical protein TNCV_4558451 [Trichonephila clavipes]